MNFSWKLYKDNRGEWRWSFLLKGKTLFKSDRGYRDPKVFRKVLEALIGYDTTTEMTKTRRGTPFMRIKMGEDIIGLEHPRKTRDPKTVNLGITVMRMFNRDMIDAFFTHSKRCMTKLK